MSSDNQHPSHRDTRSSRPTPGRPPIEWPGREQPTGPKTNQDRAADLARQQLQRTYLRHGDPGTPAKPKQKAVITPEPQKSTPVQPAQHHTMREQPYDWAQYHNAWQQYYQQYFYKYYASWWQQQRQQATTHHTATHSNSATSDTVFATNPPEKAITDADLAYDIRSKFRQTVAKNAQKVQRSSHFKPLVWSLSVAALFLLINYNQVVIGAMRQYVSPGNDVTTPVIVEPNMASSVGNEPKIIIPKIGVEAPVVYDEPRVDETSYQKALERGVVRLGNTANPGTKGNVVIGGHSSNNVFNPGKYKYVFVNLKRLTVNDIFYLNYNGTRYTYKVTIAGKIIAPNQTSDLNQTETPTVTLFTCDPPGTNVNRLIVQAVQIDPNPNQATHNKNAASTLNQANPLPSVAPSLWDRIRNLFGI